MDRSRRIRRAYYRLNRQWYGYSKLATWAGNVVTPTDNGNMLIIGNVISEYYAGYLSCVNRLMQRWNIETFDDLIFEVEYNKGE